MPACEVGAKVNFRIHTPSADEYRKIDTELNYLRCLKMRTARKYMTYSQESHGNETKMQRTCNNFLEQQDNRKFEFKWVYFTDLSQYLVPFGAVVGAIFLAFIIGAIWECRKRRKKSGKFNSSSTNIVGGVKKCDYIYESPAHMSSKGFPCFMDKNNASNKKRNFYALAF